VEPVFRSNATLIRSITKLFYPYPAVMCPGTASLQKSRLACQLGDQS
jgi:hypothetical protein